MKTSLIQDKILPFLMVVFIYSYALEAILIKNIDMTIPTFFIICLVIILLVFQKNSLKIFNVEDYIILTFILYLLTHSIFISEPQEALKIIFGSIIAFYIGRYADMLKEGNYKFLKKTINIFTYILLIFIFINFFSDSNQYRVTVGESNPIAIGELLGIFAILNFFDENGINKSKIEILNTFIGLFVILAIVGSRGAFFATILSIVVISIIISTLKKKIYLILGISLLSYLYFIITTSSYVLNKFPTIFRFSFNNIINDPSITGNQKFTGRFDVYLESIRLFQENPIFGAGANVVYSHNIFLELLASTGLVGFLIIVFFLAILFFRIWHLLKNKYAISLISVFIFLFIYRQSSFNLTNSKSVFLFAGIIVSIYYSLKLKSKKEL
ncbi:O-antigen ligase [Bacillus niacini]|uniref:O-antigen ligase n=1 Tax=Neobacillus niacini TaxID=86668 RepID=A0A852TAT3_9BACI|nr:O-antigen ligase family protein [Neobacillus niacini]NYE05892.1 O-antigen ligase [Neobacillus niacini]